MKLLLDNNISFRILPALKLIFSEVKHVVELDMDESSDSEIAEYAVNNSYIIVTKDQDFTDIAVRTNSSDIKVILIRRGNCSTSQIEQILSGSKEIIEAFSIENHSKILKLI